VLHEYVHYLLRGAGVAYAPKWYDEGLAEMLATTRLRDGRVIVGLSADARVDSLRQGIHVSLRDVVTTDDLSAMHVYRRSVFYAKAWALTHYLHAGHLLGGPDRNPDLNRYLARVQQPGSRSDIFEQSFGMSIRDMERELGRYLATSQRPVLALPADRFTYDATYARRRATDDEIAYLLGYVAAPANPALARAAFERILAVTPDDARARAGVGVTHQIERRYTEADAILARARADAPDDARLAIERADFLMVWCRDPERAPTDCPQRREEALSAYEAALSLEPESLEARVGVAIVLLENGLDASRAERLLREVQTRARWAVGVDLWLALALVARNALDEAEGLARRVLYRTEDASTRDRAAAVLADIEQRRRTAPSA
jgi:tetratricopeptide (TPR) repeat protein